MTPPAPAIDVDALLRRLHLPSVRRLYPDLAQRAEQEDLGYRDFLALLMAEEVAHRAQTRIQRCVRRAHFPFLKTIDEYDFTLQAGVRLALLGSALSPEFVTQGQTLILSGPSGTGKTHLAVAIAYRAIQNGFEACFTSATALIDDLSTATAKGRLGQVLPSYTHPHVLVIDEVGYLSYGPDAANVLFQVVNDRYLHHRPMIFTTNKPLGAWGRVLHDPDLAEAILDRVLERDATWSCAVRPIGPVTSNLTYTTTSGHHPGDLPEFPEIMRQSFRNPQLDWKRANRGKPFVGLRLDRDNGQVWVLCEQTIDGEGLASSALKALERVLGREGVDLGWFDDVAIAQARSIRHGHRLARAIVKALAVPDAGLDVTPTAVRSAGGGRRRGRAGGSPCGRGDTP